MNTPAARSGGSWEEQMKRSKNLYLGSISSLCSFDIIEKKEKDHEQRSSVTTFCLHSLFNSTFGFVLKPSFVLNERRPPSLYSELPLFYWESTFLVLSRKKRSALEILLVGRCSVVQAMFVYDSNKASCGVQSGDSYDSSHCFFQRSRHSISTVFIIQLRSLSQSKFEYLWSTRLFKSQYFHRYQ